METSQLKYTPLHPTHKRLNARMMPFGGFDMPVHYEGIVAEHLAVRSTAGLFDVSHMGEFIVEGKDAASFIQYLISNDIRRLEDGKALYTVMCNETGGIVDDLLVYRLSKLRYMLVVNASNIQKDFDWIVSRNTWTNATVTDISSETALLAIQGPRAFDIVQSITTTPLEDLNFYHFLCVDASTFMGLDSVILSHTGYTGERGLEIYCRAADAEIIWNALLEKGNAFDIKPAGLGARDTLRLESGYCLYGNDITDETSPLSAGLGWITKLDKGDFVGRDALLKIKETSPEEKLIGFVLEERGIPRSGYPILTTEGAPIGRVTSGSQSPLLKKGIGMGYVENTAAFTTPGSEVYVGIRGKLYKARIVKPPFHKS